MTECGHINKSTITRLSGPPLTRCNMCGEILSEVEGLSSVLGGKEHMKENNHGRGAGS